MPRVFALAKSTQIPDSYRLGTGHVKFFYNKLGFLFKRQVQLVNEMKARGFKPNFDPNGLLVWREKKPELWNDYQPTEEAIAINQARIDERLQSM